MFNLPSKFLNRLKRFKTRINNNKKTTAKQKNNLNIINLNTTIDEYDKNYQYTKHKTNDRHKKLKKWRSALKENQKWF